MKKFILLILSFILFFGFSFAGSSAEDFFDNHLDDEIGVYQCDSSMNNCILENIYFITPSEDFDNATFLSGDYYVVGEYGVMAYGSLPVFTGGNFYKYTVGNDYFFGQASGIIDPYVAGDPVFFNINTVDVQIGPVFSDYSVKDTQKDNIGIAFTNMANSIFSIFADIVFVMIPVIVIFFAIGFILGLIKKR